MQIRLLLCCALLTLALSCVLPPRMAYAQEAHSVALTDTDQLSVGNHARSDAVLAAADAAGWEELPGAEPRADGKPDLMQQFGMAANPGIRWKPKDQLFLEAKQKSQSTTQGLVTLYTCAVTDERLGSSDAPALLTRRFGAPPSKQDSRGAFWVYVDDGQGPAVLPATRAVEEEYLNSGRTIMEIGYVSDQQRITVFYSELALERVSPSPRK